MTLRLLSLTAVAILVAILSACGTPGAPQLPSLNLARPVEDLTASRKGNRVELDWTVPRKNTDRTLVKHLGETVICRREGTALMSACTAVGSIAVPKIPEQKKNQPQQSIRMKYVDTLPGTLGAKDPSGFVTYAIEVNNTHGRNSGLSNQVAIPVAPTIPPPARVSAEVRGDGVHIIWSDSAPPHAPAGLVYQYRIERKPAGSPAFIVLNDVEPAAEGSYLDKTFGWEQKYQYRIATVTRVNAHGINASVEGDDSSPVEVFTRDIYPPAQPGGLQAVFSSVGQKPFVDLTWAPNMETDLAGYNVFRRIEGGQTVKLNQQLLQVPSYRDQDVVRGKTYWYSVSAVDQRGNESPRSAEASEVATDNL